jgi:dUTP pyrophosphatase
MNKIVSLKGYEPVQQTPWSAWYDIKAKGTWYIAPKSVALIPIWVKVALDKWFVCLVFPRSSLPIKKSLMLANSVWVVDSDYRWEIKLQLYNFGDNEVRIDDMERIWQLVFTRYSENQYECDAEYFDTREEKYPTKRWTGWFGSTWN